ncbi:hypothetical protein BAE44_0022150, partial [Dichanthelium oligosanthes]
LELPRSEVAARVADVVKVDGNAESVFDNHPPPQSLAQNLLSVSLSTLFFVL